VRYAVLIAAALTLQIAAIPAQVREDPSSADARVQLIRLLLARNDVPGAVAAARDAALVMPDSPQVLAVTGDIFFRSGKFTEAGELYARAAVLNPKLARAIWGVGRIQRLNGLGARARQSFIKAYELDPNDPDVILDWAYTHKKPSEIAGGLERYLSQRPYLLPGEAEARLQRSACSFV